MVKDIVKYCHESVSVSHPYTNTKQILTIPTFVILFIPLQNRILQLPVLMIKLHIYHKPRVKDFCRQAPVLLV